VKIGYLLDTHAGDYERPQPTRDEVSAFIDQLRAEADLVEQYGFDSLQVPERHGRTECFFPTPLLLLTVLAERTKRIRLGTYICIPPLYNPMALAEDFAMIDHLSRGRLIMGVASGYHPGYSQFFNVPHDKRGAMFEEAFEIILRAWTEERFSFEGKHYQFHDVSLTPKPYQQPRPEIWVGGMFPKTIARAGKLGDAWCSDPFPLDKARWMEQVRIYRDAARQNGNRSQVVLMRDAWCAPSPQDEELFLRVTIEEWLFYFRYGILTHHPDFQKESDFTPERVRKHFIIGKPEECRQQIETYATEFDVDYLVLRFRLPKGPDRKSVLKSLELFGKEVMPNYRSS
jgi:alkanesulfonate monooxygenase SsuD/methylene tetrahydromethanopterin reductase-like flavin-dependent oxidoreductase (luciferase family)